MMTPEEILLLARIVVRRKTPPVLLSRFEDDLVQETVIVVIQQQRRGHTVRPGYFTYAMLSARRRVFGSEAHPWTENEFYGAVMAVSPARRHEGALCMARLQKVWATLTSLQQDAIFAVMSGTALADAALEAGTSPYSIVCSKSAALKRIDDPRQFKRPPNPQRPKVRSPDELAARRAFELARCRDWDRARAQERNAQRRRQRALRREARQRGAAS